MSPLGDALTPHLVVMPSTLLRAVLLCVLLCLAAEWLRRCVGPVRGPSRLKQHYARPRTAAKGEPVVIVAGTPVTTMH